jgi:hypothetical protein
MKNKKGQLGGLNLTKNAILIMVVIVAIAIVGILVATQLRDSGIFTANTLEYNQTQSIANNYSEGVTDFFGNVPTLFTILFVVVLVGFLALVIYVITRFGGGGGRSSGL